MDREIKIEINEFVLVYLVVRLYMGKREYLNSDEG